MKIQIYSLPVPFNAEKFHEDLETALSGIYTDFSSNPRELIVRLSDDATDKHISNVAAIVAAHDGGKSTEQIQRDNRTSAVQALNAELNGAIDITAFNRQLPPAQIAELAKRVRRIELRLMKAGLL